MVTFNRYPHITDLFLHYIKVLGRDDVHSILKNGITNSQDATILSRFVWEMAGNVNEDEENKIEVLGSTDNTEMLPDLSYELTKLMRDTGYYSIWEKISREEFE